MAIRARSMVKLGHVSLAAYCAVLVLLSIPLWLVGAAIKVEIMPGLPLAAFSFVLPGVAACILASRRRGDVAALSKRLIDFGLMRSWRWPVVLVLASPATFAIAYAMAASCNPDIARPRVELSFTLVMFAIFLIPSLCEELGWTGYLFDPLSRRWGALRAGIVIGVAWAAWHIVPLVEVGRGLSWIACWAAWTIAARTIMAWLYERGGRSMVGMALYHAASNTAWQCYPVRGSLFDPAVMATITTILAIGLWATSETCARIALDDRHMT